METFPQTAAWVREHRTPDQVAVFDEFLYNVDYHLDIAADKLRALEHPETLIFSVEMHAGDDFGTISAVNAGPLLIAGDAAIRGAMSALEVGLQLINHTLGLGVGVRSVSWGRVRQDEPLRFGLRREFGDAPTALEEALDRTMGHGDSAKAYALLGAYRDWITHRGAPRALVLDVDQPIPFDQPITDLLDPWQQSVVEMAVRQASYSRVRIAAAPFVPPVKEILNARIEVAEEDIVFGSNAIRIGKGTSNVTISDNRIRSGSAGQPKSRYDQENTVSVALGDIPVAGEALAIYRLLDYLMGIETVVSFTDSALADEWDRELMALCR